MNSTNENNTNSHILERVIKLEHKSAAIQRSIELPWYKDRRFWTGAAAIPLLVISGWTVDAFLAPGMLSTIHTAFGTHRAVEDGLNQNTAFRAKISKALAGEISAGNENFLNAFVAMIDNDKYQTHLVETLANVISRDEKDIRVAVKKLLENHFWKRDEFETQLEIAVKRRTRIIHDDVFKLGLEDLGAVEVGEWDETVPGCRYGSVNDGSLIPATDTIRPISEKCPLRYPDASITPIVTTSFASDAEDNVDINIGILMWEVDDELLANGLHLDQKIRTLIHHSEFLSNLSVKLGGQDVKPFVYQGGGVTPGTGSRDELFYFAFSSKGNSLPPTLSNDFTRRWLALELNKDNKNLVASIYVSVLRSDTE